MKQEIKALNERAKWNETFKKHETDYRLLTSRLDKEQCFTKSSNSDYKEDLEFAVKVKQSKDDTDVLKETQKELYQIESNTEDLMVTLDEQHTQLDAIKAKSMASNNLLDNMGRTLKKMKSRWWA